MKYLFFILTLVTCWSCTNKKSTVPNNETEFNLKQDFILLQKKNDSIKKVLAELLLVKKRTQTKALEALAYAKKNNFNTHYTILVDMSIHSGKKRLFVWDFKEQKIIKQGLCSHGCCSEPWGADYTKEKPVFSNTPDSHCSSLGKYKIGKRGYSNWGINVNYKLHGLESSNSNAFKRVIVLHSWKEVADTETYPNGTPEGWGCPAVSNSLMKELDNLLQKETKPLLFWIYTA
ncbi:murein L,D-transpeptidase catalytic domain-containing protein [Pseudofulvibacter geojedonensis]|uniref:Murein L,D-transpeptidase catalytic domain-containing protein n=1 Tax=Pseudofulvibacter geojedonensis TaxID=1123758 RepID=A0ABW3HZI1_9FLAO